MYRRTILALGLAGLINLAVLPVGSGVQFASAQDSDEAAPYGIADVTDASLNSERLVAALPSTWGGSELGYLGPPSGDFHPFASESESYGYPYPASVDGSGVTVLVNIANIGTGLTVAEAIDTVATSLEVAPNSSVERQDTSAQAEVPYLLESTRIVWGARDGRWVFTAWAESREGLSQFMETLVANLQRADLGNRTVERDQPAIGDADDLVDMLLQTPFRGGNLPFGTDVTGARLAPEGPTDASEGDANLGPFFGLGIDAGAEAWINMTVAAPPEMGSVYLQYAVFPSSDAAERAFYSDDIFGRVGRFPFGTEFFELNDVPEFDEPAVLWVGSNLNPGSETRLPRASVQAGVVALSGNVLVLTSVSAPILAMDTTALPDPSAHAFFAMDLSLSAIDHVERLSSGAGATRALAALSDQSGPDRSGSERTTSAKFSSDSPKIETAYHVNGDDAFLTLCMSPRWSDETLKPLRNDDGVRETAKSG